MQAVAELGASVSIMGAQWIGLALYGNVLVRQRDVRLIAASTWPAERLAPVRNR